MRRVSLAVNGVRHELDLEPRELLVYVLRERLGLTGTNVGCDTSSCGACTVLVNGESVKSCTVLGVQADGLERDDDRGARRRTASCTRSSRRSTSTTASSAATARPGMVMAAVSLLAENPEPTEDEIRHALEGNLCRCTGYQNIVKAVQARPRGVGAMMASHRDQPDVSSARRSPRKEDPKLLTGHGQLRRRHRPRRAWSGWRSCAARTRTRGSRASTLDGARASWRASSRRSPAPSSPTSGRARCRAPGPSPRTSSMPTHWPLAVDKARYVGDGVAVVVAETAALAKDAAELVEVDYEPLPAVTRRRGGARRRRAARARRVRHQPTATRGSSRRARSSGCSPRRRSRSRSATASTG